MCIAKRNSDSIIFFKLVVFIKIVIFKNDNDTF